MKNYQKDIAKLRKEITLAISNAYGSKIKLPKSSFFNISDANKYLSIEFLDIVIGYFARYLGFGGASIGDFDLYKLLKNYFLNEENRDRINNLMDTAEFKNSFRSTIIQQNKYHHKTNNKSDIISEMENNFVSTKVHEKNSFIIQIIPNRNIKSCNRYEYLENCYKLFSNNIRQIKDFNIASITRGYEKNYKTLKAIIQTDTPIHRDLFYDAVNNNIIKEKCNLRLKYSDWLGYKTDIKNEIINLTNIIIEK